MDDARDAEHDYLVVGSGSAGCVLANRLSASGASVLVIEAGGRDRGFWLRLPVGYFRSIYDARVSRLFRTEPGEGVASRRIDAPRGRVLGGSSSINGLIFIRGQREDFDDWEAMGARGWSHADVLPHFRRIETFDGPPSQDRGAAGELQVSRLRTRLPVLDAWREAAREYGLKDNEDFNGASTEGVGSYQLTLRGRWRDSGVTAFLRPAMGRSNIHLRLNAHVTRLVIERGRAVGVEVAEGGERRLVRAGRAVILAAGAVQTPQILQLSGIGPAGLLREHGIDVAVDAPGVGENLQDHLQMRTIVELRDRRGSLNADVRHPARLAAMGWDWLRHSSGPLTVGAGQVGGAVASRLSLDGRPDLQLFVMPLSVDKPGTPLHRYPGFTTAYWQCHPESRGWVRIASADPFVDPLIQPNYLTAKRDCETAVEGMRVVREIYRQPAFRDMWSREVIPGAEHVTDAEVLEAVRRSASTVYHLVGTCRMGEGAEAPVDSRLRMKGMDGLRIVDASVMPKITSANTNAATFMIADRAAALILEDAEPRPAPEPGRATPIREVHA